MQLDRWLAPERVLLKIEAVDVDEVVAAASIALGAATGADPATIKKSLARCVHAGGYAMGEGVAVPHAEVEGLEAATGALLVTRKPLDVGAVDGEPADIFFVVVAQPDDPSGHLRMLADLAVLAQSRLLRGALRQAESSEEAWDLLQAAALRHSSAPVPAAAAPGDTRRHLALVSVAGETAVDALLVELIAHGYPSALVVEAQALEDAAASEVPLFAGFREIFGDPGGRRVFMFELEDGRSDWLMELVRRICDDRGASAASVALIPIELRWSWKPAKVEETAGGH
jgi:nitrogen PTS system EIIA component